MILRDYHVHSSFSDGADDPAAVAAAAFAQGMTTLGFSDHGYAPYDTDCCIPAGRTEEYKAAVRALAEQYRGRMTILCGVEQDIFSDAPTEGYDYVIGSVHYLRCGEEYITVDWKAEILEDAVTRYFGGDWYSLCEQYFDTVAAVAERTQCDLIGHFDLVCKLNERYHFFDEEHPRYTAAWQRAAEALLQSGKPFEVNTGAISRGYKSVPYPAPPILRYLSARGAAFLLSSDSHSAETLLCEFEKTEQLVLSLGGRLLDSLPEK